MSESPFKISIDDLEKLDEKSAVTVFQNLLCEEALKNNFPLSKVQISNNTKESDDGVDAIIEVNDAHVIINDLIKNGNNYYQIKADKKFRGFAEGAILNEILGPGKIEELKNLSKNEILHKLKPAIKTAMDNNYFYILVSFKHGSAGNKKYINEVWI